MRHDISVATFVAYATRDHFGGGHGVRQVDERNPEKDVQFASSTATMLMYYDVMTAYIPVGRRRIETKSGYINHSPWYVIDGEILNVDKLRAVEGHDPILVKVLEMSRRNAIRFRNGHIGSYFPHHHQLISSSR